MKIRFASGGGVAGPAGHRSCVVDTTKLPGPEASHVQALVRAANVPGLVGRASPPGRPDEMYYEVTIEEGGGSYTVSATQRDMPAGLKPLVAWLTARAASELK